MSLRRFSSRPSNATRHGVTLLEMLGTMVVLLSIAVAASRMLAFVTDIGVNGNQARQTQRSVMQFAERFRADVRAAESVISDGNAKIQIRHNDLLITYRWVADRLAIHRLVERGDQIETADRYPLNSACDPQFTILEDRVSAVIRTGDFRWVVEVAR